MTNLVEKNPKNIQKIIQELKARILSLEEIGAFLIDGLTLCFPSANINGFFFDPITQETTLSLSSGEMWELPQQEKQWLINRIKYQLADSPAETVNYYCLSDRKNTRFVDKGQLLQDQSHYRTPCDEGVYLILASEEEIVFGVVFIHQWDQPQSILKEPHFETQLGQARAFVSEVVSALDSLFIHQKIESLISDKFRLKQKIQKDEADLNRRVLELTSLYETSNTLSYAMSDQQMVNFVMTALHRVIPFDVGSIFLFDFIPGGEIVTTVKAPVASEQIAQIQKDLIQTFEPFVNQKIEADRVKITTQMSSELKRTVEGEMKSNAMIPLVFKDQVLGIMGICSNSDGLFGSNEMTFLHTLANQVATHLGRIKLQKRLERSKISSLIHSMAEGVIMVNEKNEIEIINPKAKSLLNLHQPESWTLESFEQKLTELGILYVYQSIILTGAEQLDYQVEYLGQRLLVNITNVSDDFGHRVGTVLVFRDISEMHRSNRVKAQRLEALTQANAIIRTIVDAESLFPVIMDFILEVAGTDMGSIMLKTSQGFVTKVHSNFPDKVRQFYQYKSGESITDYVIRTHQTVFIGDYVQNKDVKRNPKVLIDFYVSIPVLVKNEIIAVVNIVQKCGNDSSTLVHDDIETIEAITSLLGTAIHNAMLYQSALEKQKMDEELRVAYDIQKKLLPDKMPENIGLDIAAVSHPAREIGGDYYDFIPLDNGKLGVIIADIVGKGVPAGLFMAMLKSIIHTHLRSIESPKDAMEKINTLLFQDHIMSKFVPMFYAVYNPETREFKYCNAGHEPAILFSNGHFSTLDTEGFPVGSMIMATYSEGSLVLNQDDLVLLFTDGLIESKNNSGKYLGHAQVKKWLSKLDKSSSKEIITTIFDQVTRFSIGVPQHDDLTVVALKLCEPQAQEKPRFSQKLKINSSRSKIKEIRQLIEDFSLKMGFDEETAFNIKLAVNEAHANVIEHAYSGVETGEIVFSFLGYDDRLEVIIKDFSPGVDQRTTKGEADIEKLEGSGLGVILMTSIMDSVDYKRGDNLGTELTMKKLLNKKGKKKHASH